MGFASKFANKTLLDQSRSKTLPHGHLNGRATGLHPLKTKSLLRGVNSRRYRHTAIRVRQCTVLDGIGAEFIEDHCERENGGWTYVDIWKDDRETRAFIERLNCGLNNRRQRCTRPVGLQ